METRALGHNNNSFEKMLYHSGLKCFASGSGMLNIQCSARFSKFDDAENLEFRETIQNSPLGKISIHFRNIN